jgi:hypothetical protein
MRAAARLVSGLMRLPGLGGRTVARLRGFAWRLSGEGRTAEDEAARKARDVSARAAAARGLAEFRTLDPWFDETGLADVSGLKLRRSDRFGPVSAALRRAIADLHGVDHLVFFEAARLKDADDVAAGAEGRVALVATEGVCVVTSPAGPVVRFAEVLPRASEDEARLLVEMLIRAVVPRRITVVDRIARRVVERHASAIERNHRVDLR